MKIIILIITLMYNAFCMGQCIDKIDSITIDSDTSHLFQHHKSGKIDTFLLEKPTAKIRGTATTSSKGTAPLKITKTEEVKEEPVLILRPTIQHNYMLFDEIKKDTIPLKIIPKTTVGKGLTGKYINDSLMHVMIDSGWATISSGTIFSLVDSVTIWGNEEPVYHRKRDTILVEAFVTDTFYRPHAPSYSLKLYSVRELHNLNEIGLFNGAFIPRNYHDSDFDYWQHLYYLDRYKEPLQKNIIVWQTKEIE